MIRVLLLFNLAQGPVSDICRLQINSADKDYLSLRTHFITVSFQLLKANRFKMGSCRLTYCLSALFEMGVET